MRIFIFLLIFLPILVFSNRFEQTTPKVFSLTLTDSERKLLQNKGSFLTQSLIASGIPDSQLEKYESEYNQMLLEIKKKVKGLTAYQTADLALQMIHQLKLKKYEAFSSTLDIAFDKGIYNCVSSSLLYNLVLTDLGFETRGAILKDHVFSQVKINDKWTDAETTVLYGFDPGSKRETLDQFKKVTGFVYVPQSGRGKEWRNVTNREYLSLVYSNRGAFLLENKSPDFFLSLKILYLSMMVSPDFNEGAVNLQAGYTQYSLYLKNQKKFDDAVLVIQETLQLFPDNPDAKNNFKAVVFDWANFLFEEKEYEKGMAVLRKYPSYVKKEELENYYLVWSQKLMQKEKKFSEAMEALKKGEQEFPDSKNIKEQEKYVIQESVSFFRQTGKIKEAQEFLNSNKNVMGVETFIAFGYAAIGKIKEARVLLEDQIGKDSSQATLNAFLQVTYDAIEQKEWSESVLLLLAVKNSAARSSGNTRTNYEGLFFQLGKNYLADHNLKDLDNLFKPFYQFPETEALAIKSLGDNYYVETIYPLLNKRDYDAAIPHLKQAVEMTRGKHTALIDNYRGARMNQGISYYRQKNYAKAYQVYAVLIKEYPKDSIIRKNFESFANLYLESLAGKDPALYNKIKKEAKSLMER